MFLHLNAKANLYKNLNSLAYLYDVAMKCNGTCHYEYNIIVTYYLKNNKKVNAMKNLIIHEDCGRNERRTCCCNYETDTNAYRRRQHHK